MSAQLKKKRTRRETTRDPVKTYKQLLQSILEQRPSGTRRRLAERLGKNRSFISQFSNPSYKTPIPSQHLDMIFEVCHFSPRQKQDFMQAYEAAHPRRVKVTETHITTRQITIEVPDLGTESNNRQLDRLITEFATTTTRLLRSASK